MTKKTKHYALSLDIAGGIGQEYPYKVTITGKVKGPDAMTVKKRILDEIKAAAVALPGAHKLTVNTLRPGKPAQP